MAKKTKGDRYTCEIDTRNWVEISKKTWTQNDLKEFYEVRAKGLAHLALPEEQRNGNKNPLWEYYEGFVTDACMVDVAGKEFHGLEEIFTGKTDDIDGPVINFWYNLPEKIYSARLKLGNALSAR